MSVLYKRTNLGEGINLNEIYDKKFKSNLVKISFITCLKEETVCANALLSAVLATSNGEYKSRSELSAQMTKLYGSRILAGHSTSGDYQKISLCVNFIDDKYTLQGEKISSEAVRQLLNCLFKPDMPKGEFNQKYFEIRRNELEDNIKASVNDKRSYGFMQAEKIIFQGEPCSFRSVLDAGKAREVTSQQLVKQYEYLKRSANVEVVFCGRDKNMQCLEMINDACGRLERKDVEKVNYRKFSPLKESTREVSHKLEVNQCKLYMGYKSSCEDIYVCKVFQMLLGGTPFSKLFSNVREKLSLCYYCSASYFELKGTLIIDSGVEVQNIQKVKQAINEQIEEIRKGNFSDEELYNTKLFMCGLFKSNYDTIIDTAGWYETQLTRGTSYTPNEQCGIVMEVTREQVVECARSFELDSVYILKSGGEGGENDG